jgi:hypothetical protein
MCNNVFATKGRTEIGKEYSDLQNKFPRLQFVSIFRSHDIN